MEAEGCVDTRADDPAQAILRVVLYCCRHGSDRSGRVDDGRSPQREGELPPQREDDGSALALRRRVGLGKGRGGGRGRICSGRAAQILGIYSIIC